MLTHTSHLTGLKCSSLIAVVLAMCSGQGCVPMPTGEVLDEQAPEIVLTEADGVLEGEWRIVFEDDRPDECFTRASAQRNSYFTRVFGSKPCAEGRFLSGMLPEAVTVHGVVLR